MSTAVERPPAPPAGPPTHRSSFGSLLRSEAHRFRSRRFIQVVLLLAIAACIVGTTIALTQFGTPGDADIARAEQQIAADVAMNEQFRQECLADADLPDGVSADEFCGPEQTADDYELSWYLSKAPFDFESEGTNGAMGFAAISAVIAALVGATWIGAEWSTRSIVALLFWVPRRMQVMAAKVVVLTGAAALIGVLAQASWLGVSALLRAAVGSDAALPEGFWSALLQTQARGVLLTVIAALLAFGLANLVRNTGAALGIAFVYLIIVENFVRVLRPTWQPWLLSNNAAALVQDGGATLYIEDRGPSTDGFFQQTEYYLGHLQSGVYLGAVTLVVVGIGAVLFARRDLQ
ncbi:ABC transporter permease subunit [Candidatus Blastococcus massiliensis]|uniref:ABC transporter permease subunit n=1 Tax=Candidatus Blastococcus massiliensis TaxID=1470358 RepID=UPI00058E4C00|nr:ABC transporter permease subunit [Candidatus Blastococcus massiliensis]